MERASPKTPNLTPHIHVLFQNHEKYISAQLAIFKNEDFFQAQCGRNLLVVDN